MAKHKIYVASSWRNEFYTEVVETLREAGHDVYDFRNPPSGDGNDSTSFIMSQDFLAYAFKWHKCN